MVLEADTASCLDTWLGERSMAGVLGLTHPISSRMLRHKLPNLFWEP